MRLPKVTDGRTYQAVYQVTRGYILEAAPAITYTFTELVAYAVKSSPTLSYTLEYAVKTSEELKVVHLEIRHLLHE